MFGTNIFPNKNQYFLQLTTNNIENHIESFEKEISTCINEKNLNLIQKLCLYTKPEKKKSI